MKLQVLLQIEDGNAANTTIEVASHENGAIFITAPSLSAAEELLKEAEEPLKEKLATWEPAEVDHQEAATEEDEENKLKELATIYESTTEGKKFIKDLETANKFVEKKKVKLIKLIELLFLAKEYDNRLISGSYDLAAYSYWKGYKAAKKVGKK